MKWCNTTGSNECVHVEKECVRDCVCPTRASGISVISELMGFLQSKQLPKQEMEEHGCIWILQTGDPVTALRTRVWHHQTSLVISRNSSRHHGASSRNHFTTAFPNDSCLVKAPRSVLRDPWHPLNLHQEPHDDPWIPLSYFCNHFKKHFESS